MPRFRHSASFGKRQEFGAIAELLRRGYDCYLTLIDDQGIDCVVRQGPRKFYDVQIKARSADANIRNAAIFTQLKIDDPRRTYVFVFYAEAVGGDRGTYWVVPSTHIVRPGFGNSLKSGPNQGKIRLKFNNGARPRPKYAEYVDAWEAAFGRPPEGSPALRTEDIARRERVRAGLDGAKAKK